MFWYWREKFVIIVLLFHLPSRENTHGNLSGLFILLMQKDMFSFMLVFSLDFMKGLSLILFKSLQYFTPFCVSECVIYLLIYPFSESADTTSLSCIFTAWWATIYMLTNPRATWQPLIVQLMQQLSHSISIPLNTPAPLATPKQTRCLTSPQSTTNQVVKTIHQAVLAMWPPPSNKLTVSARWLLWIARFESLWWYFHVCVHRWSVGMTRDLGAMGLLTQVKKGDDVR